MGLWDFLTDNADAITSSVAIFGVLVTILTAIWGVWKLFIERWWKQKIRGDVKVFDVFTDPSTLLAKIYSTENDNNPLADHKIKYQPRDPDRDITSELKAILNRSRYLLVTAPTGYGKTREAGLLAQTMMLEGWRILRIKTGWLEAPKEFPLELNNNRSRIIIFLDDLNGLFSTGTLTQSPRAEQMPMLSQPSYHDRLLQMLDTLEGMCTENEIRVIATARSEPDQWKILEFDENDLLWKRFEQFELPRPKDISIAELIEDSAKETNLQGNPDDFLAISQKSDGTYRNIILNLRRWQAQNKTISVSDLAETLNGSWRDVYERALKKHSGSALIYQAVFLLQQYKFPLYPSLVKPLARKLSHKRAIFRIFHFTKINRAYDYLAKHENILSPRDGQIEACPETQEIHPSDYYRMVFPKIDLIEIIAIVLIQNGYHKIAVNLLNLYSKKKNLSIFTISFLYSEIGRKYESHHNLEEAEAVYRKAIEVYPSDSTAYINLGVLLKRLNRYEEAEAVYRKAIEVYPSDSTAYVNLGVLLKGLNRYEEAEAVYRKAIEVYPSDSTAYVNLGILLKKLNRHDEAKAAFSKAYEIDDPGGVM